MTKRCKELADDYIELLRKAHKAIRKAIELKNREAALDLLEQCQEAAIRMGTLLEESEGEEFETVRLLEDYCEQVYQIYGQAEHGMAISANSVFKGLRKRLNEIENNLKNNAKVRTEAVFLPYKASMWDSLESVWKAADEDEDCDAYVIPIPYYDKNPDGSFREIHYEGDQYPDYVPITNYKEYDLAERHPDMIFIHNPYDDCNYVTSVEPYFYSKNLKQYTDKLIYIPYFVLGEIDPDNKEAVDGIAHFCMAPGVLNADQVIVQSEDMRKAYINALTAAAGEDTRSHWEKKILGLGSPKLDKAANTSQEDVEIPEEWKNILMKPDGSRKKIILYNTSVTALLHHDEKMIEKMRSVFQTFQEEKEDVALLWRPHPLIKATIESMRPQLWLEYEKLVEQYKEESWGIYDDTADLNRAIALCDAYYGDVSSLVQLCQEAGKPVMIQDVDIV